MLNTKKLLYILPDVAYIAELLPGKKPSTFSISSFLQINGEYMDDNEFIGENVLKLFKKIDPAEYRLILPDFLFTNTIINVKEKSETKIKEYLVNKLLPDLDINAESYHIDTTILNEHAGTTRVQLSALEKSLLAPVQVSSEKTKVKISGISPLSWSIKSLVSLEPSVSVIQIDSMLYVALHYIGVDQASQASVDNVENIYETIKTLKGAEPSIQTVYLISNELVEEKLKEHLSDTLPIQQLATKQDTESKMPSYIKKIIESGMRTLSIEDYPVPNFELGKAPAGASIEATKASTKTVANTENASVTADSSDLPTPQKQQSAETKVAAENTTPQTITTKIEKLDLTSVTPAPATPAESPDANVVAVETQKKEDDKIEALLDEIKEEEIVVASSTDSPADSTKVAAVTAPVVTPKKEKTPKKVIKNREKTKTMLKMAFVTLAVFFTTVAVGIGIGLGVLQLTQSRSADTKNPVVVTETTPTPSPSPSPSPSPTTVDTSKMSVLVVNATTKAGYAGDISDLLLKDFASVKAGNAKGDYKKGNYILLGKEDSTLINNLEKTTKLNLTFQEKATTEDPKDQYDVVIVLAK